jgi:ribonuclease HI
MNQPDRWTLFVDGASRNNPGISGAGIYIEKNEQLFFKDGYFLGIKTNNEAEYLAFLFGILVIEEHMKAHDQVHVFSDSQLLVNQLRGIYRVRVPHLQMLHRLSLTKLRHVNGIITHVLRDKNVDADAMANAGIDHKKEPPHHYLEQLKKHEIFL